MPNNSSALTPQGGPSLGVQVLANESGTPGLRIVSIDPHSLADEAGLRVGDTMIAIDGFPCYTTAMVARQLERRAVGERIRVRLVRDGKSQEVEIPLVATPVRPSIESLPPSLTRQPNEPLQPIERVPSLSIPGSTWTSDQLGMQLVPAENRRGLVVAKVNPNSPASAAGIREGDRIVSIDGHLVSGREALDRELANVDSQSNLSVKLVRGQSLVAAVLSQGGSGPEAAIAANPGSAAAPSGALGGLGSMIGGLFGGAASSGSNNLPANNLPATNQPPRNNAPSSPADELPDNPFANRGFSDDRTNKFMEGNATAEQPASEGRSNDSSGLEPNGEPIERTVFEMELNKPVLPEMDNDPPSLRPLGDASDTALRLRELKQLERQLRLELDQVRRQIEQLESK